jgi:hypothetical protein
MRRGLPRSQCTSARSHRARGRRGEARWGRRRGVQACVRPHHNTRTIVGLDVSEWTCGIDDDSDVPRRQRRRRL